MQDHLPFKLNNNFELLLFIKLKPNSTETKFIRFLQEETKNYLLISVNVKPIDNKANNELMMFLAKLLKIPKTDISLIKGVKSSYKTVVIKSENLEVIISKIMELK